MDLNGKKMNAVSTAENGKVGKNTVFRFEQTDSIVSAEYEGGRILKGFLVGKLEGDELEFRYAQIDKDGNLDGGRSSCKLSTTPEGKLRLVEHFTWESMEGSGTNVLEEIR